MRTKFMAILMAALFCVLVATPVSAATGIAPFWTNTHSIALSLTFASGQATAGSIIDGNNDTASITATFSLQEKTSGGGWTTVKTWPQASATDRTLTGMLFCADCGGKLTATVLAKANLQGCTEWVPAEKVIAFIEEVYSNCCDENEIFAVWKHRND